MARKCVVIHQHTCTHIYNSGDQLYNESVASCPGDLGKSIAFSVKQDDSNKDLQVKDGSIGNVPSQSLFYMVAN